MNRYLKPLAALAGLVFSISTHGADLVGSAAPEFRLQDQQGEWHDLEQYRGKWVALYFYPKDDTPGCTTEACSFRDNIFAFDALNAVVLGVSLDDVDSHAEFAEKYSLPFSILADSDKQAAEAYGVIMKIGPMKLAKRESFLIDPNGVVVKHYSSVNPNTHTEEVLADLRALGEGKTAEAG
ncbi:MAG: peroxiredoxin [Gammaproteobacteria bacterium]|nr:peroxiredoxin [Gammaproteobacteria bacterium]